MAEQIAGDLVRKSKVFLFPFFLIVRNSFAAEAVVSLLMLDIGGGKLVSLAAVTSKKRVRGWLAETYIDSRVQDFPISGWNNNYN